MSEAAMAAAPAPSPSPSADSSAPIQEAAPAEAAVEDAAQQEAKIEEKKAALKKKYQLKLDGKEENLEVDLDDDESMKRYLQKAKMFDTRSEELSGLKKQVNAFVDALKGNTVQTLSQMGLNVDELMEAYINDKLSEAQKSPEQLAKEQMESELKQIKEEKEKLQKDKESAEMEQLKNHYAAEIEKDIDGALSSNKTILPKNNPLVIKRIAETMMLAIQNGYPDITAKDVIPMVEEQFKRDLKSMFDVFPEDVIENVVGKNNLDRYRKTKVKAKKAETSTPKQMPETEIKQDINNKDKKKVSYKDFFNLRS